MNGNVSYLTTSLFQKICAAFPGTFNLDYLLTGEGELLLPQDASKVALTYQQSTPTDADMTHRILDMNAQIIADLRRDLDYFKQLVLDKDAIIQDNAEQIISLQSRLSAATNELEHTKNTLAAVRKNFDAKVAEVDQLKVELEKQRDPLARYPFTPGVADGDNDRTTITTDK
jgi:septal ring factor EnvC (AmiA/AmiB activator)